MEAETNLSNDKIFEQNAEDINEQKISSESNVENLVSSEAIVSENEENRENIENSENIPQNNLQQQNVEVTEEDKSSKLLEDKNVEAGDSDMVASGTEESRTEEDALCSQKSDTLIRNIGELDSENIPQDNLQQQNVEVAEEDKSSELLEDKHVEAGDSDMVASGTEESRTEEDALCSQKSDTLIRNIGELDLRQEIRESNEDPEQDSELLPNANPAPDPNPPITKSAVNTQKPAAPIVLTSNNTSLGLLASEYRSSSTDESDDDSEKSDLEIIALNPDQEYRNKVVEINSDTSDESDIEIVSQVSEAPRGHDDLDIEENDGVHAGKSKKSVRAKGEFLLEDLPPIQDLHISVSEEECAELGTVESIVDQLVLVNSIPGTVPLDLDTILFLDKGKEVLGEVFDVLGQVCNPLYCVRFNSNKQIKERGIEVGQTVYVAPRTEHTKFIILPNLMKIRGSDASWEHDVEPAEEHLDYSDDEQERDARRSQRNKNRGGDDVDLSKKARTSPPASPQVYQQRYQRPRYSGNNYQNQHRRPPYNYQQQQNPPQHQQYQMQQQQYQMRQPFNYDGSGSSWHMNYNQVPPNFYPNPYAMPHISPNAMQQPLFPPTPPPPPPPY